jgi:hypothetical protein
MSIHVLVAYVREVKTVYISWDLLRASLIISVYRYICYILSHSFYCLTDTISHEICNDTYAFQYVSFMGGGLVTA